MSTLPARYYKELFALFAAIENEKEAKTMLEDLFTPQEIDDLAQRWQLIQELIEGKPQRQIAEDLGISISKITRGSTMLKHGSGAFEKMYKKLKK
jgi:TrpR family trp operon transcriptional repressor